MVKNTFWQAMSQLAQPHPTLAGQVEDGCVSTFFLKSIKHNNINSIYLVGWL